jgi:3-deoxy-D-manno-octulosonic acid kinase
MPLSPEAIEESCLVTAQGAILFDRARIEQATADLLDPAHWGVAGDAARGGRGQVWFVDGPFGEAVLRHYRRGGMIGRLIRDRYLWAGAAATRSFREFRLLAELRRRGLPVPAPLMAGFQREGRLYRADLLMARVPGGRSLAERLPQTIGNHAALEALGRTLGRFHAQGVCHADLNAHNLLADPRGAWWLIDFDRGRLRRPQPGWQQRRLQRLQRSLRKLGVEQLPGWEAAWDALQAAHDEQLAQPA